MASIHEAVIEFPDNKLLIDLCGEYDKNLAEIERSLSLSVDAELVDVRRRWLV